VASRTGEKNPEETEPPSGAEKVLLTETKTGGGRRGGLVPLERKGPDWVTFKATEVKMGKGSQGRKARPAVWVKIGDREYEKKGAEWKMAGEG